MSKSVDQRVVEMQFDNKQFESGIKTSLKSLENLRKGLNFDKATKSLANIEKATKNFSVAGLEKSVDLIASKFTNLGIVGVTALQRITNAAITTGSNLIKSLTLDPVLTGFQEYETKMGAITTILTNTASKGTTLEDVNKALNELNKYADQTIYNFAEMTKNIGTFTAAGVDLETSVEAIKGISNLAAGSGSTPQQAATAMYQLSQALAAGRVSLQDWNSVVNAGMGGELFQNALKETAKQMGIVVDESVSFRESISAAGGRESWLTSDVLIKTLQKFANDPSLTKAATQVKTFTQLIDTMKESVQSGWAQSWEYIIGDSQQAAELFTNLSNGFNSIIQPSTNARNAALQFWNANGGREAVIQGLTNVLESLGNILGPIREAFNDAFPAITGERLVDISNKFLELTERFKVGGRTSENIRKTFKALFDTLGFGVDVIRTAVGVFGRLVGAILPVGDGIFGITGTIGGMVSWIIDAIDSLGLFQTAITMAGKPIEFLVGIVGQAANTIGDLVSTLSSKIHIPSFDSLTDAAKSLNEFKENADGSLKVLKMNAFGSLTPAIELFQSFGDAVITAKDKLVEFAGMVRDAVSPVLEKIQNAFKDVTFDDVLGAGSLAGIAVVIYKIFKRVEEAATNFEELFGKAITSFTNVLDAARESLEVWQKDIQAGTLLKIAGAVAILAASLIALTFVDPDKLAGGLIGVSVLLAEVVATMEILNKFPVTNIAGAATSMVIMGIAISVLAGALTKLKDFQSWDETWPGLVAVGSLLMGLAAAARIMGKGISGTELIKTSVGLVIFAEAVKKLAEAMSSFAALDAGSIAKSLGSLGAILAAITIFIRTAKLDQLKGARLTILEIATSMIILYGAIELLGRMDMGHLIQGLTTVGVLIGALSLSLRAIGSVKMSGVAASILAMATAMNMLIVPVFVLGSMNLSTLAKGLSSIAVALTAMTATLGILSRVSAGGTSLIAVSTSMVILAGALTLLLVPLTVMGALPWQVLAVGLGSMVVVLAALGATAYVLAPLGTALLTVAGALALFGVAAIGVGVGIAALSTGLATLAVSGAAGIGVLLGALTGILAMIPVFAKELALGLTVFVKEVASMAPILGDAFVTLVLEALESIGKVTPAVVETFLYMLSEVLDSLLAYAPNIGQSLVDLFIAALDVVDKNIPVILDKIASILNTIVEYVTGTVGDMSPADIQNLLNAISTLVICFKILSLSVGSIKTALKSAAAMAAVVMILSGVLFIVSLLPVDKTLPIVSSLTTMIIGLSAAMFITSMIPVTGAMTGIAGLGVFVAGLTAIVAALGGLSQIPGFTWLIGEGSNALTQLGTALGNFVGSIAGGLLTGVTSSFPQIGRDLSDFMTNASPFFEGLQNVDASAMEGVKALASSILVLTAADVINGLTSWFTGGSSLVDFGKQIAEFAPYFKSYSDQMQGVDATVVTASANAAKALAEFASNIPNSGGVAGFFAGENDISDFGKKLADFGPYFAKYASSISGVDSSVVSASSAAAQSLAKMASAIPNTGGLVSLFTGDNDISKFGKKLADFGPYFAEYANSISGISPDAVTASASAAKALAALAENLPNSGGLVSLFTGDNNISDFGKDLKDLGKSLQEYYSSIKEIDIGQVSSATTQIQALMNIFSTFSTADGGSIDQFLDTIKKIPGEMTEAAKGVDSSLSTIQNSVSSKSDSIAESFSTLITRAINAMNSKGEQLSTVGRNVANRFVTNLNNSLTSGLTRATSSMNRSISMMLNSALKQFNFYNAKFQNAGRALIDQIVKGINTRKTTIGTAINAAISSATKRLGVYTRSFYIAGQNMAQGLANGLRSGRSSVINAASSTAADALSAAKRKLGIHSPSKEFEWVGEQSDNGLIRGLLALSGKVRRTGENVGEAALSGVGLVLRQLPGILDSDVKFSPRITPVLDLSNVTSGASSINGMIPSNYGIHTNIDTSDINRVSSRLTNRQNGATKRDYGPQMLEAMNRMSNQISTLGNRIEEMQVVLDTGATVGALSSKIDQKLGQTAKYKRRNI